MSQLPAVIALMLNVASYVQDNALPRFQLIHHRREGTAKVGQRVLDPSRNLGVHGFAPECSRKDLPLIGEPKGLKTLNAEEQLPRGILL
jgi:hypothetical protein